MAPEPLRIGVIGCGTVGRLHLQRLSADPRVAVQCVCDPHNQAAADVARQFAPAAEVFTDDRRALDAVDLHAVVLCSPTTKHFQQCMAALDRGLHILCEKPLATDRDEIEELVRKAQGSEKIFSIAYQRRCQAPYLTARRELQFNRERYGQIQQIHCFVCERWAQTIAGTWRDDPAVGSGYFGDAGTHQIDSIFFITGTQVQSVAARSDRRGRSVEIVTEVMAELTDGVRLFAHFVGDAHHWREDIHFHCEHADLLLRDEVLYRAADNHVEPVLDLEPNRDPDRAFVDAVLDGAENLAPPDCALPMWDWTDAVLKAIQRSVP